MEELSIDFMMLADGAQAVGGKLYVLGGGWTHLLVPEFPGPPHAPFAIAIGMIVPWHLTNRKFRLAIELADADGNRIDEVMSGEFEQGRPPGLRAGTEQRVLIAIQGQPHLPSPGRYVFNALIDGQPLDRTSFEAVALNPVTIPPA